ncbi:MAG: PAC2 family protein [Thermoplasmata archaeon]|nr:PAC2 family protein [Thermoplasmata archaeon]
MPSKEIVKKKVVEKSVRLIEQKQVKCENAVFVEAFPSVGLIGSIVGNFLVDSFKLERVATIVSDYFPPVAIVRNSVPSHPVRIYGNDRILVFLSEFVPDPFLTKELSELILELAKTRKCSMIISPEGVVYNGSSEENHGIYGVGSTPKMRKLLEEHNITALRDGIISGISGMLLADGELNGIDVLCLLAESNPKIPDARAAIRIVHILDELLPDIEIDVAPLEAQAAMFEKMFKESVEKARTSLEKHEIDSFHTMYG